MKENGAKFARHSNVNEEADGGIEQRKEVHQIAERKINSLVEGFGGKNAIQHQEEALGKFGQQKDQKDGGELKFRKMGSKLKSMGAQIM